MKKKLLITVLMILFTMVSTEVFADSNISLNNGKKYTGKGFVFTDKLKIRNAPNLQSEKTGSLEFGDVISFYEVAGSGGTAKTVEDMDTLVILDNPSFRKFLLCDYIWSKISRVAKITDEKILLDYGVKVGMPVKDLYEIIGKPVYTDNNLLDYFGNDQNATMELKFKVKDGKILEINFEFYK